MPNSVLWVCLVAIWLFVLVPMVIQGRPELRKSTPVAAATRVLKRGEDAVRRRRIGAGAHPHDPSWKPKEPPKPESAGGDPGNDAQEPSDGGAEVRVDPSRVPGKIPTRKRATARTVAARMRRVVSVTTTRSVADADTEVIAVVGAKVVDGAANRVVEAEVADPEVVDAELVEATVVDEERSVVEVREIEVIDVEITETTDPAEAQTERIDRVVVGRPGARAQEATLFDIEVTDVIEVTKVADGGGSGPTAAKAGTGAVSPETVAGVHDAAGGDTPTVADAEAEDAVAEPVRAQAEPESAKAEPESAKAEPESAKADAEEATDEPAEVDKLVEVAEVDKLVEVDAVDDLVEDDAVDDLVEDDAVGEADVAAEAETPWDGDIDPNEMTQVLMTRPGRGGYDPEVDLVRLELKYKERQRVLLALLAVTLLTIGAGVLLSTPGWIAAGVMGFFLVSYLVFLRRAVTTESRIRQRRLARLEENRREDVARRRREFAQPAVADPEPAPRPRLRRPSGMLVVDIDDEDPAFDHLPTYYQPRMMRSDDDYRAVAAG